MKEERPVKLLICGGGSGAHTFGGLASSRINVECRILTMHKDQAKRWNKNMGAQGIVVDVANPDGSVTVINGRPSKITKHPEDVVKDSDVIVFIVPARAHGPILDAILPHIMPNTVLVGLPGHPGFLYQCVDILKDKVENIAIAQFEFLPWACRIEEYGKRSKITGTKYSLGCSITMGRSSPKFDPIDTMQRLIGEAPLLYKFNTNLSANLNGHAIHAAIMYGTWVDWDGKPLDKKPLFYQGLNDKAVDYLDRVSREFRHIAKVIMEKRPDIDLSDVIHISDWVRQKYKCYITDFKTLKTMIRTNKAYDGLLHPVNETIDGKYVTDVTHRYYTEDTPYGIVVVRGIAQCAGIATPVTDEILRWCQEKIGKEFLVGDKLCGKDMEESRAPQRYGVITLDDLLKYDQPITWDNKKLQMK